MNYPKLKLLARMSMKLFFSLQMRKLANYALYRISIPLVRKWGPDKLVFSPPNVVIAVTSRCNKQCTFCYYREELNGTDADKLELTYERFLRIITHPLIRNSLRIAFTGGEPLLNKDIFKMIREARRRHHIVSVITNGKLLRKYATEICNSCPDILIVSYYPEDHDQLVYTLPLFTNKVPIKLNYVMSINRIKQLENALQLAVENNFWMVDIEYVFQNYEVSIEYDDERYWEFMKQMKQKYGRKVLIAQEPLINEHNINRTTKCRVFWHSIHIDALGRILPCCRYRLKTSHEDIFRNRGAWNSEVMTTLRLRMRKGKIPDGCKNCNSLYEDYLCI